MTAEIFANYLFKGRVVTDSEKKATLNRHIDLLDKICESLNITKLSDIYDYTDFFISAKENLIENKPSFTEDFLTDDHVSLMAKEGVWIDAKIAVNTLNSLLAALQLTDTYVLSLSEHEHITLCREIMDGLNFAQEAEKLGAPFNFSVIQAKNQ